MDIAGHGNVPIFRFFYDGILQREITANLDSKAIAFFLISCFRVHAAGASRTDAFSINATFNMTVGVGHASLYINQYEVACHTNIRVGICSHPALFNRSLIVRAFE